MFRLGPDSAGRALDRPHVRPMDFTGRPGNPHRRPRIATAAAAGSTTGGQLPKTWNSRSE